MTDEKMRHAMRKRHQEIDSLTRDLVGGQNEQIWQALQPADSDDWLLAAIKTYAALAHAESMLRVMEAEKARRN